mmetsp:Transcript_31788/g.101036  ORF Transcript_31788/g.101036 Transcript_31788/m.101036 type:complete len:288 (-) Transcript_31788:762-1625(-)
MGDAAGRAGGGAGAAAAAGGDGGAGFLGGGGGGCPAGAPPLLEASGLAPPFARDGGGPGGGGGRVSGTAPGAAAAAGAGAAAAEAAGAAPPLEPVGEVVDACAWPPLPRLMLRRCCRIDLRCPRPRTDRACTLRRLAANRRVSLVPMLARVVDWRPLDLAEGGASSAPFARSSKPPGADMAMLASVALADAAESLLDRGPEAPSRSAWPVTSRNSFRSAEQWWRLKSVILSMARMLCQYASSSRRRRSMNSLSSLPEENVYFGGKTILSICQPSCRRMFASRCSNSE